MSSSNGYRGILAAALFALAPLSISAHAGTLEQVKARGAVKCGVSQGVPGLSFPDASGNWTGLDADYCKALALATLGDATKVLFMPLASMDRFAALQSGEVDVLVRSVTWTISRDASLGFNFRAVNFYDGQGFLVRKSANIKGANELSGASICVPAGTTTEQNTADYFRANNMKYDLATFGNFEEATKAYEGGRCDSLTADRSQLAGQRTKLTQPDEHVILPDIISKEPIGPVVRQGDEQWFDIVTWVHFAMVSAEELGIRSDNVDDKKKSDNPEIRRLLGLEGKTGELLGLSNDWAYKIIKTVGNYGQSYDRNLGPSSKIQIERGLNNLWTKGGLQYSPPIR